MADDTILGKIAGLLAIEIKKLWEAIRTRLVSVETSLLSMETRIQDIEIKQGETSTGGGNIPADLYLQIQQNSRDIDANFQTLTSIDSPAVDWGLRMFTWTLARQCGTVKAGEVRERIYSQAVGAENGIQWRNPDEGPSAYQFAGPNLEGDLFSLTSTTVTFLRDSKDCEVRYPLVGTKLQQTLIDLDSELDRLEAKVDAGADAKAGVYTKSTLPVSGKSGDIALVTDGTLQNTSTMAYYNAGKWYRTHDNSLIQDNRIDIFIIAGQSNAHGHALVSDIQTEYQSSDVYFYTSWHEGTSNASTQQYYSEWSSRTEAGKTRGDDGESTLDSLRFGPEIGFASRGLEVGLSQGRPMGIIKYGVGASGLVDIGTTLSDWDIDSSFTDDSGKRGDCWRGLKRAIGDAIFKLGEADLNYRFAGLVWWQGESGTSETDLNAFINALATHLDSTYGLDMHPTQFPCVVTGTTNYWGTSVKNVSDANDFIGYVNAEDFGQQGTTNVHPGSGENGLSRDTDNNGNNDMLDAGFAYANEMELALTGDTLGFWQPSVNDAYVWLDASRATSSIGSPILSIDDRKIGTYDVVGSATVGSLDGDKTIEFDSTLNVDYLQSKSDLTIVSTEQTWYIVAKPAQVTGNQDSLWSKYRGSGAITLIPDSNDKFFGVWYLSGTTNGFIKASPQYLSPTEIKEGRVYQINQYDAVTDFTQVGAVNNHQGTVFTATLDGSDSSISWQGTGKVREDQQGHWNIYACKFVIGSAPTTPTATTYFNGSEVIVDQALRTDTAKVHITDGIIRFMAQYGATPNAIADGAIAEALVTTATSDHQKIEGYLAHKWGLESKLPASHPYKSSRP